MTDDKQRILDAMLDPVTSPLISELEGGPKTVEQLCKTSGLGADEIHSRFEVLVECGVLIKRQEDSVVTYEADAKKLDDTLSDSNHFDGSIDMLTKMDSFLN